MALLMIIFFIVVVFIVFITVNNKGKDIPKTTTKAIDYNNPVIREAYMKSIGVDSQKRKTGKNPVYFEEKKIESKYLFPNKNAEPNDTGFYRKKVVFTGDLTNYDRNHLAEKLWILGADIDTSVGPNTDIVIIGEDPGPLKMQKIVSGFAKGKKIKVLYENDLIDLRVDPQISKVLPFFSKKVHIAGDFEFMTSDKVEDFVKNNGGSISKVITAKLDYIIAGNNLSEYEEKRIIQITTDFVDIQVIGEDDMNALIMNES